MEIVAFAKFAIQVFTWWQIDVTPVELLCLAALSVMSVQLVWLVFLVLITSILDCATFAPIGLNFVLHAR